MTSELDVGGMAIEVELSKHLVIDTSNMKCVWNKGVLLSSFTWKKYCDI